MARIRTFQGFPWGVMVLCTIVFYATTIVVKHKALDVSLGDTDDAMRLVQFREYLQHGNWFDLHTSRVGGAEGYTTHWSRIPDAIMAGIFLAIQPFTSVEFAERATRMIYPGFWIAIPAVASSLFGYWFTGNRLVVVITVLLFALNPVTFIQFGAGRIDHHNAQIALAVLAIVSSALQRADYRIAMVSGASIGLLFTIGLEALPFAIVSAAAVAVNYAFFDDGKKSTRGFTAALVIAIFIGFIISFPSARYLQTACDGLGINLVAAVGVGGLVLLTWSSVYQFNSTVSKRCLGLVFAVVSAIVTYTVIDTACLSGPFGHISSEAKVLWLNRVMEMQPLLKLNALAQSVESLRLIYIVVLALPALVFLMIQSENRFDFALLVIVIGFAVSLFLGFMNTRMATYVTWFATPLVCLAIVRMIETFTRAKLLISILIAALLSPHALLFLERKFTRLSSVANNPEQQTPIACDATQNFPELTKLPKGLIMSEIDLGPYVLAHTQHSVVAAPYHRLSEKIIEVIRFFGNPVSELSHQTVKTMRADYVLICRLENVAIKGSRSGELIGRLHAGQLPSWLQKIELSQGNPLVMFKVVEAD